MLETEDKNCEPPSIGLPLSLISHYFLLLKYLEGGGGGWYIIIDNVYMIGVVACPGWWLGLSGRVTQSVRVTMCRQGRVHVTFTSAPTISPRYPGVVKIVCKRKLFFEHG